MAERRSREKEPATFTAARLHEWLQHTTEKLTLGVDQLAASLTK